MTPILFYVIITWLIISQIAKKNNNKIYTYQPGKAWEEELSKIIIQEIGENCRILNNLYIPKENGSTTEIDIVIIDHTGLYCIECKDYSGWIFGKKTDTYWTTTYRNGEKHKLYNPYFQNENHIKYLKTIIPNKKINNIVVFSDNCKLKNIILDENITQEYQFRNLLKWYRDDQQRISIEEMQDIYLKLLKYTNVSEEIKQKHITDIKTIEKYNIDNQNK